jgi:RNA-directed DNA polymerase
VLLETVALVPHQDSGAGTILGTAIRADLNRGGPWAMSRRLAAQTGMTNQWLKDQGLISVQNSW